MKRSTTQVAVAVAEAAAVAAVDDEDGVQCQRWGGHSMVVAAFDGGHTTTSRARNKRTKGQRNERTRGRRNERQHSNQPAQDNEMVAQ